MRFVCILCLVLSGLSFYSGDKSIAVEKKKSTSGNTYTIIWQHSTSMEFTDKRPDENDKSVQLCIAAAFTQLDNYRVDGVYLCNGKIFQKDKVNKSVGGGIKIVKGQATIFPTQKGKLLSEKFLNDLAAQKASFFQQIQLIENGKAASFKDKAHFQRRAIVIFKDGKTAVVESAESLLLSEFSSDLVELGAKNALYTDMGGWDEGYYVDPVSKKKIIIGLSGSHTAYQSNWVLFRK